MRLYKQPDGSFTMYPVTKEAARKERVFKYDTQVMCSVCQMATIKHVMNGECVGCQNLKSQIASELIHNPHLGNYKTDDEGCHTYQFYKRLVHVSQAWHDEIKQMVVLVKSGDANGPVECCPKGHVGLKLPGAGGCYYCQAKGHSPRKDALAAGEKWYMPPDPCKVCQTTSLKRVDNGQCKGCQMAGRPLKPMSPRQRAIREAARWYTPLVACKGCGMHAKRRVNNGECSGCTTAEKNR